MTRRSWTELSFLDEAVASGRGIALVFSAVVRLPKPFVMPPIDIPFIGIASDGRVLVVLLR